MAERLSALAGNYPQGRIGAAGEVGVRLEDIKNLVLHQVGAWPATLHDVGRALAAHADAHAAPKPCSAIDGSEATLLRVEPLKWWLLGLEPPELDAEQGALLDLSHSRTRIRVSGPRAAELINRHLPLDLRDASFPQGSVASSAFHHVGVTVWRSSLGFEMFLPRGYAMSLWEMLLESAGQFGAEVV